MMKQLFLLTALCATTVLVFSQQADLADKKAVGHNRIAVTKATTGTAAADKTGKNDVGVQRGKQMPITAADTTGLSSQQKHIGK